MNRLKLDFSLQYEDERAQFVQNYINTLNPPPTPPELETIADYIMWGKTRATNKPDERTRPTPRHNTWETPPIQSLDALLELPTFNEAEIHSLGTPSITAAPKRTTFSREEALAQCGTLEGDFRGLWSAIDRLEYKIQRWEKEHGRRKTEPRLAPVFGEEERVQLDAAASHWNQFMWLKQRHILVELRREQYTMRDAYRPQPLGAANVDPDWEGLEDDQTDALRWAPLGGPNDLTARLVWVPFGDLRPGLLGPTRLGIVVKWYWSEQKQTGRIDLRRPENWALVVDVARTAAPDSDLKGVVRYYGENADLTPAQRMVLDGKVRGDSNAAIAAAIEREQGKRYMVNYISTIYHQKVLPRLADAAAYHELMVQNLPFVENWKECRCCGRVLLVDEHNWMRKARSADGFDSLCKGCNKERLKEKKEKNGKVK